MGCQKIFVCMWNNYPLARMREEGYSSCPVFCVCVYVCDMVSVAMSIVPSCAFREESVAMAWVMQ